MSVLHPIVAVTGSSGAGTSSVKLAFERIFQRERITPAIIEGDSFHRYDRKEMEWEVEKASLHGRTLTHFGPEGNLFDELERLFRSFGADGAGQRRFYIHTKDEADAHQRAPGTFTDWQPLPEHSDLLFYEGLHGALVADDFDIAQHVDLLIGVVPIINLEWIQKIQRDRSVRGYSAETATAMILRRMPDYVHYICPQFSRTDINFQRIPTIDTSNPFTATEIPSNDESMVVIHVASRRKINPDFRYLLEILTGSFMSRPDTIIVPAGKNIFAMELLLNPVIENLMEQRDRARTDAPVAG
jgi:phosphoribulokinase